MLKKTMGYARGWIADQIVGWGLAKLAPFGATAMTAVAGYLEGFLWFYVIIGCVGVFAATAWGALISHILFFQKSSVYKLVPSCALIQADRKKVGAKVKITKAQIGVVFQNIAVFPIQYRIDNIRTNINQRTGDIDKNELKGRTAIIFPGKDEPFWDNTIEIGQADELKGLIEIEFSYGRIGKLDHAMNKKFSITAKPINEAVVEFHWRHAD